MKLHFTRRLPKAAGSLVGSPMAELAAAAAAAARGRPNLRQLRATLAVTYSVQLARVCRVEARPLQLGPWHRQLDQPIAQRRRWLPVRELDVFGLSRPDLRLHADLDRLVAGMPDGRAATLAGWFPPVVAYSPKSKRWDVYENQLTTALLAYRHPEATVLARVYKWAPKRQLTFAQAAGLCLWLFDEFPRQNRELICRLAATAAEAGQLVERSINAAAVVRKRLGVLRP